MGMQVTVDGVNLDNDSWRFVVEETGDDIGLDQKRALAVDFIIEADSLPTLETRYATTRDDFIKSGVRVTMTHDDTGSTLYADVSPGDGVHTDVHTTIGRVGGKTQTGFSYYCRLYVVASIQLPNASAVPGSGNTAYAGLIGMTHRTKLLDQGGVESRSVLASFGTTYDGTANGAYTVASVADSGGKAVFTLGSTPVAFSKGMRLEVSGSTSSNGAGYNGVHLITAINTGAKTVTTDSTFDGDETATSAYIGDITTAQEAYDNARSSIFTELLGVETDGSRDSTTGLKLTHEKFEDSDELGKTLTVLLMAEEDDGELTSVNNSDRGFEVRIAEIEPDQWHPKAGTKPRTINVEGSATLDKALLAAGGLVLHQVFNSTILAQIKSHVLTQTGYAGAKLRSKRFESRLKEGRLYFSLVYQAKNLTTIDYKSTDKVITEDNTVSWKAGKYDYEQRPEGLPPQVVVRTVTRVGWTKSDLNVPTPSAAQGASFRAGRSTYTEETETSPDGNIYIQAKSQAFVRVQYDGGGSGGGPGVVNGGGPVEGTYSKLTA